LRYIFPGYFHRALNELGIGKEDDGHGGRAVNALWSPNSLDASNKTRSYSRNYIEIAINRPNFHVLLRHQATKLLTSKEGNFVRVIGVEVRLRLSTVKKLSVLLVRYKLYGAEAICEG
jgi:hypothetical protein